MLEIIFILEDIFIWLIRKNVFDVYKYFSCLVLKY